jgi:uncharacterized hydrophobic protein (TIGR00271 family)
MFNFVESKTLKLRRKTEEQLQHYTRPSVHFFVMMVLSSCMATLGLLLNSAAIVVGAMVVAPLITPLFGFALSTLLLRSKTMSFSFLSIILGTAVGYVTAILMSLGIDAIEPGSLIITEEILVRTTPNIFYLLVAIISGLAGAYAYGRPELSERVVGIAIAVALIPPLTVSGIGIAMQEWTIAQQSFLLYLLNLAGILLGSIVMFLVLGFGKDIHEEGALD